ncbi:MAG: DUF3179 domain-containing (seleno)protein [Dehalococcoidia bacterium]
MTAQRAWLPRRLGAVAVLALGLVLAAGCIAAPGDITATPPAPTEEPVFRPIRAETPADEPLEPLTEDEVDDALREAICWYPNAALAQSCLPPGEEFLTALQRIALSEEQRFVAPLVDMLWLDLGWERWVREALERLTGQRLATAAEWYAWMMAEPPPLPDDYAEWKGRLLALIDLRFRDLIPEAATGSGPGPEHLVWSLVGADSIPPLTAPETVHRAEERYLGARDIVFGVAMNGVQRAYPERILGWHGSIADDIEGTGILVWHCPTCGGAAVFDRVASDGVAYTFTTAGLVWESRRLFTDEETDSLWDAVSGRAVAGPLAAQGVRLTARMSVRTTWGEWDARYPNTRVLSLDTGFVRDYSEGAALLADSNPDGPAFPTTEVDDRLEAKTRVLGVTVNGARKAYPLGQIEARGMTLDTLGGVDILIFSPGAGLGATVYDTAGTTFEGWSGPPEDRIMTDSDNLRWFVDDERLLNTRNSRERTSLPAQVAYWFAWSGAFPDAALWGE